jgi:hypothetical protein
MRKRRLQEMKQQFSQLLGRAPSTGRQPAFGVSDFKHFLTTGPRFELPEIERSIDPERTIDL